MSLHPIMLAARDIASDARSAATQAKDKKAQLQDEMIKLQLKFDKNEAAADRFRTFQLHRNGMLQCPRCWIIEEIGADLSPIPNDNRDDKFRCPHCGDVFILPF